jgi:hypothetical protein
MSNRMQRNSCTSEATLAKQQSLQHISGARLPSGKVDQFRHAKKTQEDHDKEVWRLWKRDQARLLEAEERALHLPDPLPEFAELVPGRGLGKSDESRIVKDMCSYFHSAMEHLPFLYTTDSRGKLVPPQLLGPGRWHATRHEHWKAVPLTGQTADTAKC